MPCNRPTCHDKGNGGAAIGEEHGPVGRLAGQDPLVVALPRDSSEHKQEPVIYPYTHILRLHLKERKLNTLREKSLISAYLSIPSRRYSIVQCRFVDVLHMLIGKSKGQCKEEAEDNEEDLDDVSVGHGDEATQQGVAEGDHGGHDDGNLLVDVEDDLERGAESAEDGGRPEDLGQCSWQHL